MTELWDSTAARCEGQAFRIMPDAPSWQDRYRYGRQVCGAPVAKGITWDGRTEGRHSMSLCAKCLREKLGPMIRGER